MVLIVYGHPNQLALIVFDQTPALPYREARLEFDSMTQGVHPVSGQRKVLADRAEAG
jgi:hypothetical protein